MFGEKLRWRCEDAEVLMTHIGGYPGKYAPDIRTQLYSHPPHLFICGHSHILKVQFDPKLGLLHINPGAAGIMLAQSTYARTFHRRGADLQRLGGDRNTTNGKFILHIIKSALYVWRPVYPINAPYVQIYLHGIRMPRKATVQSTVPSECARTSSTGKQ